MPIHKVAGGWQWDRAYGGESSGATAAGIALRSPQGRLLFLKRSSTGDHPGEWCFPGGHIEGGETPLAAAVRETLEETGHNVKELASVELRNGFATYTEALEGEFVPTLSKEHTAYAWASPEDAPGPLHSGVTETLRAAGKRTHDAQMLDFAGYYAPEKIGKTRHITPEGYLVLEGTPIARIGEQVYNASEINKDVPSDDPKYVRPSGSGQVMVQRLPEEVFHPDTLASFEGKDFVIEHPPEGVDITNWKNQTVGHVQNVRRGEGIEDDLVIADIIVKDPMAIEHVNKHLPELSAGYRADYEPVEPGRAIQRNIIGNHVAAVKAGRAGARVAVRDHEPQASGDIVMPIKTPMLRAVLAAVGIKTDDAAKIETALSAVDTSDEASNEKETAKKMHEISGDMKAIKDWMAARDAEREEEKKREEKETADKAARDAEAEKEKSQKSAEFAEKEATGDTLIEAEGPGMAVNLGKTWTGSMTGDSAAEPVLTAVNARAEILAPGVPKLTTDAVKGSQGRVLAAFMRSAIATHAATPQGKANVRAFMVNDSVDGLKGERLVGVFNGVSQLAFMKNRSAATNFARRPVTSDTKTVDASPAKLNEANRAFWADRAKNAVAK